MKPWEKEKLARAVMEELEPHASGAWFTPQAIVALDKFKCSEEMALEVFADLIKRKMLVSAPFTIPVSDKKGQKIGVFVSAWSVNDDKRKEIKRFIHDGGLWHMYVSPTVKWFWGFSRYRFLIILTFALAAFFGGALSEAGKSFWALIKWDSCTRSISKAVEDGKSINPAPTPGK